jgi:hypothetical protein
LSSLRSGSTKSLDLKMGDAGSRPLNRKNLSVEWMWEDHWSPFYFRYEYVTFTSILVCYMDIINSDVSPVLYFSWDKTPVVFMVVGIQVF